MNERTTTTAVDKAVACCRAINPEHLQSDGQCAAIAGPNLVTSETLLHLFGMDTKVDDGMNE